MGDSSASTKGLIQPTATLKDDVSKGDISKDFLKAENPDDERVRSIILY
jgi:hypothetical protein